MTTFAAGTRVEGRYRWPAGTDRLVAAQQLGASLARVAPYGTTGAFTSEWPRVDVAGGLTAALVLTMRQPTLASDLASKARIPHSATMPFTGTVMFSRTTASTSERPSGATMVLGDIARDPVGAVGTFAGDAAGAAQRAAEAAGAAATSGIRQILVPVGIVAAIIALVVYAPVIKGALR